MQFRITYNNLFMVPQALPQPVEAATAALAVTVAIDTLTKEAQASGYTVDFDYAEESLVIFDEEGEELDEFFSFQAEAVEAPTERSVYKPSRPSQSINKASAYNNTLTAEIYRNAVRFELKTDKRYKVIKLKRVTSELALCLPWRLTATSIVVDQDLFPQCLELEAIRDRFLQALESYF